MRRILTAAALAGAGIALAFSLGAGTRTPRTTYNVRDTGAIGNGSVDDTAAIQKALTAAVRDGGTVYLPNGTYRLTRTLDFAPASGRHSASLEGENMTRAVLAWDGPAAPALRIRGGFGIHLSSFSIQGSSSRQPAVGIDWPADSAHPSAGSARIEQVFVDQAVVGMEFCRGTDLQVSEVTVSDCIVQGAAVAYHVEGWNALNFLFLNCGASHGGTAWEFTRTNSHTILGGSCSQMKTVLSANAGGVVTMQGVRAEECGRLADLGPADKGQMGVTGAALQARIRDCSFFSLAPALTDTHAIRIGAPGPVEISGCQIMSGNVGIWSSAGSFPVVTITGSVFEKGSLPPVTRYGDMGGNVSVRDCRVIDQPSGGSPVGVLP